MKNEIACSSGAAADAPDATLGGSDWSAVQLDGNTAGIPASADNVAPKTAAINVQRYSALLMEMTRLPLAAAPASLYSRLFLAQSRLTRLTRRSLLSGNPR
jgi:hypothetical protein